MRCWMPDIQIAAYGVGILVLIGGLAAIARGLRQDVREIVTDLVKPILLRIEMLEKELATEREERRKGDAR